MVCQCYCNFRFILSDPCLPHMNRNAMATLYSVATWLCDQHNAVCCAVVCGMWERHCMGTGGSL